MSLDSDRWGNAIADEVSAAGLEASEQTSIRAFWKTVTGEHVLEITTNQQIAAGGAHVHGDGSHSHPAGDVS